MRFFAILALMATPALADENCGPAEQILGTLAEQYGEGVRFTGLDNRGVMILLLTNPETESWTAVQVDASGKACMVAAGGSAQITPPGDNT